MARRKKTRAAIRAALEVIICASIFGAILLLMLLCPEPETAPAMVSSELSVRDEQLTTAIRADLEASAAAETAWVAAMSTTVPELEPTAIQVPTVPDTPLGEDLTAYLVAACQQWEVPMELALAVIEQESSFDPEAMGPDGRDKGLFQVRQSNFAWLVDELGITDLTNPEDNIMAGVYMLADLLASYPDHHMALTAYRWGPKGARDKYWNDGVYESPYSQEVMQKAAQWAAKLSEED